MVVGWGERSEPRGKAVIRRSPDRGERFDSNMLSVEWFLLAPLQGLLICNIIPGVSFAHPGLFTPALFRAGAFSINPIEDVEF